MKRILLICGIALAARETPLYSPDRGVPCEGRFEFVHRGDERELPVHIGKGPDRQIVVFCLHVNDKEADTWPVHIIHVFDDPEPLPAP